MKIKNAIKFQTRIMKIMQKINISCQNLDNHEIHKIQCHNNENHENLNIPRQNYENHNLFLAFHYRITKIMKL